MARGLQAMRELLHGTCGNRGKAGQGHREILAVSNLQQWWQERPSHSAWGHGWKSLEESAWRRGGSRDEEGENRGPYSEEAKAQNNLGVVTTQGGHSEKQAEGKGEALIPTGGSQGFTSNSSTAASHTLPCEDNDISTKKPVLP